MEEKLWRIEGKGIANWGRRGGVGNVGGGENNGVVICGVKK